MGKATFHRCDPELLRHIAENMRPLDAREVWASSNLTPMQALEESVAVSDMAAVACLDGVPVVAFGLRKLNLLSGTGVPWLLGTDTFSRRREFIKWSRLMVDEMIDLCPRLVNHVHVDNIPSINWLRWLGFTLEDAAPYGIEGEMFHKFTMERGDV